MVISIWLMITGQILAFAHSNLPLQIFGFVFALCAFASAIYRERKLEKRIKDLEKND